MAKYQNLTNEVMRSWKLKGVKIVPLIIGATVMIKKNFMKIWQKPFLGTLPQTNYSWRLSGAQWQSWKEPLGQTSENNTTSQLRPWITILHRNEGGYFESWQDSVSHSETPMWGQPISYTLTWTNSFSLPSLLGRIGQSHSLKKKSPMKLKKKKSCC